MARKTVTLEDLREEFLAHCEARDLAAEPLEERVRVTQPMSSTQNLVSW